jgi:hypothetical protein
MGCGVVQGQGALNRHVIQLAQHGLWIGHDRKFSSEVNSP